MSRTQARDRLETGTYRVAIRLSKADLAKRAGLSRATIAKIESGQPVERITLLKLLDALIVEADRFRQSEVAHEIRDIRQTLSGNSTGDLVRRVGQVAVGKSNPALGNRALEMIERALGDFMASGKIAMSYQEDVIQFHGKMTQMLGLIKEAIPKLRPKPPPPRPE